MKQLLLVLIVRFILMEQVVENSRRCVAAKSCD